MSRSPDLVGQQFNKLTVRKKVRAKVGAKEIVKWECDCACGSGKVVLVETGNLTQNRVKSCGCLQLENTRLANTRHGLSSNPFYHIWINMMNRCYREEDAGYKNYGGRGISVAEIWHDMEKFMADAEAEIGVRPNENMTFDRKDNNLSYQPRNIRWVNDTIQQANKRSWSASGFKCVKQEYNQFRAQVRKDRRVVYLAYFKTPEEAAQAVNMAYAIHYPEVMVPNPTVGYPEGFIPPA